MNNTRAHMAYLRYVLRHKWFVFSACLQLGVPFYLAIFHDMSKFSRSEWSPYVHSFYNPDGTKRNVRDANGAYDPTKISREFDYAWLNHQKHNKHHWQHWVLINDEDGTYPLEIPRVYILEMLADWSGAGMAIRGISNPSEWYKKNKNIMILHDNTRKEVENLLRENYGK